MCEEKNIEEIKLNEIDWNVLNNDDYIALEAKLQANQKKLRKAKPKEKRNYGKTFVKLKGNTYEIKQNLYNRLVKLKSPKSKETLIDEIISTHNIIDEL